MKTKLIKRTVLASAFAVALPLQAAEVEVLHWWTSGGEAAALNVLKQDLEGQGIGWKDMPVAGGGGTEAMTDPGSAETGGSLLFNADCMIDVIEPTGAELYARIELNNLEVVARMRANCGVQAGQTASVTLICNTRCCLTQKLKTGLCNDYRIRTNWCQQHCAGYDDSSDA